MIPGSIDEEYINIIESTFLETKERKSHFGIHPYNNITVFDVTQLIQIF